MGTVIDIAEVQKNFYRILEDVAIGAEVIIAKAGKPMARLSPITPSPQRKKFGLLKGRIKVPDDFNAPLYDSVLTDFGGR